MYQAVHSTSAKVTYNQVDPSGRMRNISLMHMLEEAAIEHCDVIDRDVFTLLEEGFGWILLSGSLRFDHYPRYNDRINTDTWISHWRPHRGTREFLLKDDNTGRLVARASTQWAYVNAKERHITPVAKEFLERWPVKTDRAVESQFIKRPLPLPPKYTTETFTVRRHDIDSNNHVHNGRFLEWVLETVPNNYFENRILTSLEGRFIHEARLHDRILVQAGERADNELVHNVVRQSDGVVLSTGRSQWRFP
ncbi:MAG: thioesterase [Spirochaetales bacterium]|nr:thioesterase [Spirochaetales bacterium]